MMTRPALRRAMERGRHGIMLMFVLVLVAPISIVPLWWNNAQAAPIKTPSGPFLPGDEPSEVDAKTAWTPTDAVAESVSTAALPPAGSLQRKAWDASEKRRKEAAERVKAKARPVRANGTRVSVKAQSLGARPIPTASAALSFPPGCEPLGGEPWFAEYFPGSFTKLPDKHGPGSIDVRIVNHGTQTWHPEDVWLGYHRLDANNNEIAPGSTPLTVLPAAVNPDQSIQVSARFDFLPPGVHNIAWDLWVDGLGWLSNHGVCAGMVRYTLPNQLPSVELGWPPNYGTVTTLTPMLSATGDDPDNWPSNGQLTYQFVVCSDAGFTSGCHESAWLTTPRYVIPDGKEWGDTFWWKARVNDGAGTTDPGTTGHRVTIVVPAPAPWATVGTGMGLASVRGMVLPHGVWTRTEQDAIVNGDGIPLQVMRTYSSAALENTHSAFGRGWLSMFDASIRSTDLGTTYTVTYPDGRQEVFGRQPDGKIVSRLSSGVTNAVSIDSSGAATVRTSDQEVLRFDAQGELTRIERTGQGALRFVRDASGVVSEVVQEPSGGRLRLSWSAGETAAACGQWYPPMITGVTLDPTADGATPAKWTYDYSCGQLVEVCDPTGACSVKEQAGVMPAATPEGRDNDHLTVADDWTDGATFGLPFDYRKMMVVTAAGSTIEYYFMRPAGGRLEEYVDQFNDFGGITVEVCYQAVDAVCSQIESYYFDELNRLRIQTTKALSAPHEQSSQRIWDYNEINGQFVAFFDENFNGVVMYYDAYGNLKNSNTFRDPNTEIYRGSQLYDPLDGANLSGRVRQLSESPKQMPYPPRDNFFYDSQGRLIKQVGNQAIDANGNLRPNVGGTVTDYTYTTGSEPAVGGRAGSSGGVMPPGLLRTTKTSAATTSFSYNANGDLTEVVGPTGLRTSYSYNGIGRRISESSSGVGVPAGSSVDYHYDAVGRVVEQIFPLVTNPVTGAATRRRVCTVYDRDGLVTANVDTSAATCAADDPQARVTRYEYDNAGRLSASIEPDGARTNYTYDWFDRISTITDPRGNILRHSYDRLGRLWKVTSLTGSRTSPVQTIVATYGYDPAGRKIYETDALGRATRYEWTGDDLMSRAIALFVDSEGEPEQLELWRQQYDSAGRVIERVDGGIRKQTWLYDPEGKLAETVLDPGGLNRIRRYSYDSAGRMIAETLTDGTRTEVTRYVLDASGNILSSEVENGELDVLTKYSYDSRGLLLSATDPRGIGTGIPAYTTNYTYDVAGQLTTVVAPPSQIEEYGQARYTAHPTQTFGYDAFGALTHSRDPRGNTTVTSYDKVGRVTAETKPAYTPPGVSQTITAQQKWSYHPGGDLASQTDPAGAVTNYSYDIAGNLTEVKEPTVDGQRPTTVYAYDEANQLKSVADPIGAGTTFTYDALGRIVFQADWIKCSPTSLCPVGERYTYDSLDNLLRVSRDNGTESINEYNVLGEKISEGMLGLTTKVQMSYDVAGRLSNVTDRRGETTRYTYDLAGRLTAATYTGTGTTPQQVIERFGYDPAGNPETYTNPAGIVSRFEFDATNQLTHIHQPVNTAGVKVITTAGYDSSGNQTRITDGRLNQTWRTYNSWDQVERVIEPATTSHPDESQRTWASRYDIRGLPVAETHPGGVNINRTFDSLGNLLTESGAGGPNAPPATRSYKYDLAGRVTAVGHPGGEQIFTYAENDWLLKSAGPAGQSSFTYDTGGRVTSRSDHTGTSTFTWTPFNALSTSTDPYSNSTASYFYSDAGELQHVAHTDGQYIDYSHGFRGRITDLTSGNEIGGQNAVSINYTYDAIGNVTTKGQQHRGSAEVTNTYTYDLANRLDSWTESVSGTSTKHTYGWDKANNRTGETTSSGSIVIATTTSTFDQRNRPLATETTTRDPAGTDITQLTQFTHTERGTRSRVSTPTGDTDTVFDALGRMTNHAGFSYRYDALNRIADRDGVPFSYDGLEPDPILAPTNFGTLEGYTRGPAGEILAGVSNGSTAYPVPDAHGDIVAWQPANSPEPLKASTVFDPFGVPITKTGASVSSGFQSDWTDPNTGQVNMGARWYDPISATFTSRDAFNSDQLSSGGLNRFGYANANPLAYTDPTGMFFDSIGDLFSDIGDAISSAASAVADFAVDVFNCWAFDSSPRARKSGATNWDTLTRKGATRVGGKAVAKLVPGLNILSTAYDIYETANCMFDGEQAQRQNRQQTPTQQQTVRPDPVPQTRPAPVTRPEPPKPPPPRLIINRLDRYTEKWSTDNYWYDSKNRYHRHDDYTRTWAQRYKVWSNGAWYRSPWYIESWTHRWQTEVTPTIDVSRAVEVTVTAPPGTTGQTWADDAGECGLTGTLNSCLSETASSPLGGGCAGLDATMRACAPRAPTAGNPNSVRENLNTRESSPSCGMSNSFVPGTEVLMADGTSKPIEEVRVGDQVLATDPVTGKTAVQTVAATIAGNGTKHLVDITIETGDEDTSVLTATDGHPFWVTNRNAWIDAGDLQPGDQVLTPTGAIQQITAIRTWTGLQRVHNLTVSDTHTYFVLAGDTPVLVHNCGDAETTPLYRVSPRGTGADELNAGLDPANFPMTDELDGSAHFGNLARVEDFLITHSNSHGVGYRVDVPTRWLRDNEVLIWEGYGDQIEYVIPRELLEDFNQFPRTPWRSGRRRRY